VELLVLFFAGIVATFYGVSVGGAGLIITPLLIFLGFTAQEAVATSIFGYTGMLLVGFVGFHKAGKIDYKVGVPGAVIMGLGALAGAFIMPQIPNEILKKIIGGFIIIILIILLADKSKGIYSVELSGMRNKVGFVLVFLLGITGSVVSGGVGILASYILLYFFGYTFVEGAGTRKPMFVARMVAPVVVYSFVGLINWQYGTVLLLSGMIGSYFGTKFALSKGSQWVRTLFIIVVLVSGVKLLMP